MSTLADVILGNPEDDARVPLLRQGVVTATNPLSVRVGAATTSQPCRTLASYVPTVGDAVSVLVISGDRLVLGAASSTPSVGGPRFRITGGGAGESVPDSYDFVCGWISEVLDTHNLCVNGRFTATTQWQGRWRFDYATRFQEYAGGFRSAWIQVSPGGVRYCQNAMNPTSGLATIMTGSADVVVPAGAIVDVHLMQTAGGPLVSNNSVNDYFQGRWISAT